MCIPSVKNVILSRETVFVALFFAFYAIGYYPNIFAQYQKSADSPLVKDEAVKPLEKNWQSFDSAYFTVEYSPDVNLEKVEKKLRKRGIFFIPGTNPKTSSLETTEDKIAYRLDVLFGKAKDVLDMRPRIKKIKIKIFKNQNDLDRGYLKIFNESRHHRSFYIYRYNMIYTSEDNISDSVMAHEMGHAIVDHYFVVRPPEDVRELLAQYVDLHLED